jgi:hypothetical protein
MHALKWMEKTMSEHPISTLRPEHATEGRSTTHEELIFAALGELGCVETHDINLRNHPLAWDAMEALVSAVQTEAYAEGRKDEREESARWQPIETAPKDGTYILVASASGPWVAHWAPVAVSGYRFEQPWRSVMLNHDHIHGATRYLPPTHWMPLPDAPTASASKAACNASEVPTGSTGESL